MPYPSPCLYQSSRIKKENRAIGGRKSAGQKHRCEHTLSQGSKGSQGSRPLAPPTYDERPNKQRAVAPLAPKSSPTGNPHLGKPPFTNALALSLHPAISPSALPSRISNTASSSSPLPSPPAKHRRAHAVVHRHPVASRLDSQPAQHPICSVSVVRHRSDSPSPLISGVVSNQTPSLEALRVSRFDSLAAGPRLKKQGYSPDRPRNSSSLRQFIFHASRPRSKSIRRFLLA